MAKSTEVGSINYPVKIDLPQLKKDAAEAEKIIDKLNKKMSENAKKSSSLPTSSSKSGGGSKATPSGSTDAASTIANTRRQAEQTLAAVSSYAPKVQAQMIGVERANSRVELSTMRATNAIQKYGADSVQATSATATLRNALVAQSQANTRLSASLDETTVRTGTLNDSSTKLASGGLTMLKVAAVAAGAAVAANIGSAVARFDTLNNAPKVLQNLGNSAEDSEASIGILDRGIRGLPTSLDSAVSALTKISAASNMSSKGAAQLTLAFNNMALAGGNGPAEAERALVQFTQALGKGKMPAQEFNTMMDVMPAQMLQVAQSMLGAGANAYDLRDALGEGKITMGQFSGEIIRLNTQGGDGFASFAQQAKDATAGVATGWTNMKTSITRGVTEMMERIGGDNIQSAIEGVGKAFERALGMIGQAIGFIQSNWHIFGPIIQAVAALGATFLATSVAMRVMATVSSTTAAVTRTLAVLFAGQGMAARAAASGNMGLATSLMAARAAAIRAIAAFTIVGTIMAAIGWIAGQVFGGAGNDIENGAISAEDIAASMKEAEGSIGGSGDEAGKLAKEMAKIAEQSAKINEDFRYQLAELVASKNQNIATLRQTLAEEEAAYLRSYNKRITDFRKNEFDEQVEHGKKTRALQTQIDFLTRYNNTANQRKLAELKFALARENHEYQTQATLRRSQYEQETEDARIEYEKRRMENQTKLNADLALLQKHREDVNSVRGVILLDEIEKLKQSKNEQLKSLQERARDAGSQGLSAGNNFSNGFNSEINKMIEQMNAKGKAAGNNFGSGFVEDTRRWLTSKSGLIGTIDSIFYSIGHNWSGFLSRLKDFKGFDMDWKTGMLKFRNQGGPVTAGQPYIVGENSDGSLNSTSELFIPNTSGSIISAKDIREAMGGGGGSSITIQVNGTFATSPAEQRKVAEVIAQRLEEVQRAKGYA